MRSPHSRRACPDALGINDKPRVDLAGERDHAKDGRDAHVHQPYFRHHNNSIWRRPKTLEELRASAEFTEIYDRGRPGYLAGRCRR